MLRPSPISSLFPYTTLFRSNNLDLKEYIEGFNRAKKIENKGWDDEYYLIYHQKLDYVVPMAFQSNVALMVDFEGAIINNIYNESPNYKIKSEIGRASCRERM